MYNIKNKLTIIIAILFISCSSVRNVKNPKSKLNPIKNIVHYTIKSFFDNEIVFDKNNATIQSSSYNKQGFLLKERYIPSYNSPHKSQTKYFYDVNNTLIRKELINTSNLDTIANDDFYSVETNTYQYDSKGKLFKDTYLKKYGSINDGFETRKDSILYKYNADNLVEQKISSENNTKYFYKDNKLDSEKLFNKKEEMLSMLLYEYDAKGNINLKSNIETNSSNQLSWKYIYSGNNVLIAEMKTDIISQYLNIIQTDSTIYKHGITGKLIEKHVYHSMVDDTQDVKETTINKYNDKGDVFMINKEQIFIYKDSDNNDNKQKTEKNISIEYIYDSHNNWINKSTLIKEVSSYRTKVKRNLEKREIIYF